MFIGRSLAVQTLENKRHQNSSIWWLGSENMRSNGRRNSSVGLSVTITRHWPGIKIYQSKSFWLGRKRWNRHQISSLGLSVTRKEIGRVSKFISQSVRHCQMRWNPVQNSSVSLVNCQKCYIGIVIFFCTDSYIRIYVCRNITTKMKCEKGAGNRHTNPKTKES